MSFKWAWTWGTWLCCQENQRARNIRGSDAWPRLDSQQAFVRPASHQDQSWFQRAGRCSSARTGQKEISLQTCSWFDFWQLYDECLSWRGGRTQSRCLFASKPGPNKVSDTLDEVCRLYPCVRSLEICAKSGTSSQLSRHIREPVSVLGEGSEWQSWQRNRPACGMPHTPAVCCGNGNTIWLTAVWTTHKEHRRVPWHFHSWAKPPLYIFLQKQRVLRYWH